MLTRLLAALGTVAAGLGVTTASAPPAMAGDEGCGGWVCHGDDSVTLDLDLPGGSDDSGGDGSGTTDSASTDTVTFDEWVDSTCVQTATGPFCPGFDTGPTNNGPAVQPPDVTELARHLVEQMPLAGPAINTTPPRGNEGAVGLPVWLWTDRGAGHWGTVAESLSAGGITVSASARPTSITWDMGDGGVFTCDGPGTPYRESYGVTDSPTCGHRYEQTSSGQPNGAYTITGTTHWAVTWSATTGQAGSFAIDITESQPLEVGEIQVVTTR